MFQGIWKNIFGIMLVLVVNISVFALNLGGAVYGVDANMGAFVITLLYIMFWGIFAIISKEYKHYRKLTLVMSLLTLLSSVSSLLFRLTQSGFVVAAFLSVFASVPFYGLRFLVDWTELYFITTMISIIWVGYVIKSIKNVNAKG